MADAGLARCSGNVVGETGLDDLRARVIGAENAAGLSSLFKALSDGTRLRLISLLVQQELCVGDLAAVLGVSQSVVSHQLRDMRRMGWVRCRREGRYVFYALDDQHVRDLYHEGLAHIGAA